ncbi:MAG: YlxR family protein [Chloroflexota bacterium]
MPAAQLPKAQAAGQAMPARHFPVRTCVACRAERQKRDFLRIVRAPDGTVSIDASGKLSGRGAYLCADGSCWAAALKKKSIERALGVTLPADVRVRLEGGVGHGSQ